MRNLVNIFKRILLGTFLFISLFSSSVYSKSLIDSLTDKLMSSIGADSLMSKVSEMESIVSQLEVITKNIEAYDIEELGRSMTIKALDKYKELGCDLLPDNYENMSWEELQDWNHKNGEALNKWVETLSPEQIEEANKWVDSELIPMTNPIMSEVNKLEKPLYDLQDKLNETEPLLDNFISGYKNLYGLLQDKDTALSILSQYPEWPQMQEKFKEFGKIYATGDRIKAFKVLDEITGLFSNSKAGQGWKYALEVSDQVNLGKYVAKIIKPLVKFSGSNELDNIDNAQIEKFVNDYIKEFKSKTSIKDVPNDKNAEIIKNKLDEYVGNVDEFIQLPDKLEEFSNSPAGKFVEKQLNGQGMDALADVMSKYSGVDKKTIQDSGIMDFISDTTNQVAESQINGKGDWREIAIDSVKTLISKFILQN